ncbi:MAG: cyclic pyranopterin monophosphate synthase MoaC [Desulfovibrionaceae bacterium]|nr:cyclic pyranopterin monophosphate synthase MoaC [Desulfovibrionaceae bacterium]MDD4951828.1 cyclic pyranopterin monophosphate synthase MoaC [Desulfovibrionaceae bacterium]
MADQDSRSAGPGAVLSHVDAEGAPRMVDVSGKAVTLRVAVVRARVVMSARTLGLLRERALPKGDALNAARMAGILAAKRTPELIPLCHPLPLGFVDVRFEIDEPGSAIIVEAEARAEARTGVEMEALIAAQVAAATIYDMCKAVQKDLVITDLRLVRKTGGKSGDYRAE